MRPFRIPASIGLGVTITSDKRSSLSILLWHVLRIGKAMKNALA